MKKLPSAKTLKDLYDSGFSIKKIARIYNVSYQAVSAKMRAHGYEPDKALEHQSNQLAIELTPTIIRYRKVGYSYDRIAKLTNVPASTVKRICNKAKAVKGKRKSRLSDFEIKRLKALRKDGHSYKDIGQELGYDTMTIWRADKEFKGEHDDK